ncbi:hypothetical protein EXIGLDRAFT_732733 [Exidia glandulosa HHB12029]|uniref:TECPR1-like DysF domain-containing protein n=1 Tax=Exidia glandulosa HHB12029 TaxID=1314781 RepID=A0A165Z972_EXIGL|nr:hypothetical protein EXIGLDRAFT_732733 [Exidia glandulosa HHB12029]
MAAVDSPLHDPYISFLLAPPLPRTMSDDHKQSNSTPAPSLTELLSLPPHVTRLLVDLAPFIARTRWLAETLSWQSPRTSECWLLLGAWWGLCLVTEYSVRYFLPFALLATLPQLQRAQRQDAPAPATEQTLHDTLEHVARIQALVPHPPPPPTLQPHIVLRVIAISWIPYMLAMHFVGTRVLLAILGTLVITWRAPWARSLRSIFAASAYTRHAVARCWSVLSGEPMPQPMLESLSLSTRAEDEEQGPRVRFLFTVYENQRWWVGLDWTAALVPSERPSWCSSNQQPVAPPSVFVLPPMTTVYADDGKGGRVKRTARWTWEEGEWKVVVRREVNGAPEVRRVEKQPLFVQEDAQAGSKLAKKLKDAMASPSTSQDLSALGSSDAKEGAESHARVEHEEFLTDADGWTYFDNKWESPSNKGAIGKFTRYRRWTRIACLSESVEHVGPGELGVFKDKSAPALLQPLVVNPATTTSTSTATAVVTAPAPKDDRPTQDSGGDGSPTSKTVDSPTSLRQRLKAAVKNV